MAEELTDTSNGNGNPPAEVQTHFPLSEPPDPALQYVVDRWSTIGEGPAEAIVVEGRVASMTCAWEMKRGDYQSEVARGYTQILFNQPGDLPFKCDFIIRKPRAIVMDAGDDAGILQEVFRRMGRELGLGVWDVVCQHMQTLDLDTQERTPKAQRVVESRPMAQRKEEIL